MINANTKLTVLHDDNSVFADVSNEAVDFTRDPFSMTMVSLEDYLYIGFRKPINAVYVELDTPNINANSLTAEIYDGTSWVAVTLNDETNGLTRSGFITWDKSDMSATTVNSINKYYIRIKPSADHSATQVRGINLVFSDDNMLKQEFFEIDNSNLLSSGENSHIMKHVSARNHIIQMLKNRGYIKVDSNGNQQNIDQWDLHEIQEVRQAATMLALSKIFFNLSDSVDDNWWQKYREYQDKYEESFKIATLFLDADDDGVADTTEKRAVKSQRWGR